jgi:hypothetical protein
MSRAMDFVCGALLVLSVMYFQVAFSLDQCSVPSPAIALNWTLMSTGSSTFSTNSLGNIFLMAQAQQLANKSVGYVFGGHTGYAQRAALYQVDLLGNSVRYLAGGTTDNFAGDSTNPRSRNVAHMWITQNNMLWLYGGNSPTGLVKDMWTYNLTKNDGVFTSVTMANTGPGLVASGAYWYKPSTNELFLFGGYADLTGDYQENNNFWKFDTTLLQWIFISGSGGNLGIGSYTTDSSAVPRCRRASAFTQENENFYLYSGSYSLYQFLNDVWKYNDSGWFWLSSYLPVMVNDENGNMTYPSTRAAPALWYWKNSLVAYGGKAHGQFSDTWLFDLNTNRWVFLRGPFVETVASTYNVLEVTGLCNIGNLSQTNVLTDGDNAYLIGGANLNVVTSSRIWRLNFSQSFECSVCTSGYFSRFLNANSTCEPCAAGLFNLGYSLSTCSLCSQGKYSQNGSTSCYDCPVGKFSPNASVPCTACPKGTFGELTQAISCDSCTAGLYNSHEGMSRCSFCQSGFYSQQAMASVCSSCPLNSVSEAASSSVKQCECKKGYYGSAFLGEDCVDCPTTSGIKCDQANLTVPYVETGYFRSSTGQVIACYPVESCAQTGESQNTSCGVGYEGENCGSCLRLQFYRKGSSCVQCPSKFVIIFQISAVLLLIFICLWLFTRHEAGLAYEVKIIFQALQLIATYPSLNLQFPDSLVTAMGILSITNMNIDVFSPECTTPLSFWNKFILKQFIPFISMFLIAVISSAMKILHLKKLKKKEEINWSTFRHMLFVIWSTVFISLFSLTVSSWSSVFNCTNQGGGVYTLVSSSSFYCYDAIWKSYLPSIVIFGVLNLVISPAILLFKLFKLRNSASLMKTQKKYAFLIGAFHPAFYYWELVLALKKALIFFSLSFVQVQAYKYVLAVFFQFVFAFVETLVWPYKRDEANRLSIT